MAYDKFDYAHPDPTTDNGTDAFDYTRKNLKAVRDGVMMGGMPGWELSLEVGSGSNAFPDARIRHRGVEYIRAEYTYNSNNWPTQIVWKYSSDSGSSYDTIGTETFTYDADGYLTGSNWT